MLNGVTPSDKVLSDLHSVSSSCDLTLANLEVPLTHQTTKTTRKTAKELLVHDQWILKAAPQQAAFLASAGIGLVSLANNHAMDYGLLGLKEMIAQLDANRIAHSGAGENANIANRPTIVTLPDGRTVALLSTLGFVTPKALLKTTPATLHSAGVSVLSFGGTIGAHARAKLKRWIEAAHQKANFVIIGIHWGIERKSLPTPYQVTLARALIDAGADVVWGNHPHVLQGAELYKGHLIMYSMGNLISNLRAQTGVFRVRFDADGTQTPEFIPARDVGSRFLVLRGKDKVAGRATMHHLCRLLLQHYPSTVSVPAIP